VLRRLIWSCIKELFAVAFQVAVYLGVLAGVIALAVRLEPLAHDAAFAAVAPKPQWVAAERSPPAFGTNFPDIPDPHPGYAVLRDSAGGGRRDVMTFARRGRSATIEVYRPGSEIAEFAAADKDIVARVGQFGAAEAIVVAPPIDSRFGPVALVDFVLTVDQRQRGCLGFVHNQAEPRLQIIGWACQSGPEMVLRPTVACALDRLTLLNAGNDQALARYFARAEVKAAYCAAKRPHGPGTLASSNWLDSGRAPKLRGNNVRR
jgi:hypothetical protein